LQSKGKAFVIDMTAEQAIIQAFTENDTKNFAQSLQSDTKHTDRLIDMLQAELDIKNKQIEELNARLAEVSELANISQRLHAGTIQQQLTTSEVVADELKAENAEPTKQPTEPNKKRGLFDLFRR
jgi:hypothetical protein